MAGFGYEYDPYIGDYRTGLDADGEIDGMDDRTLERLMAAYGLDDNASNRQKSFGFTKHESKPKKPEPVLNDKGEPLTEAEVEEALAHLEESRLRIDDDVYERVKDRAKQAEEAKRLRKVYKEQEDRLRAHLREVRANERARLSELGARPFGMPTDEGNVRVTEMVDGVIDEYERELQALKERTAARVREGLDRLDAEGYHADADVRDEIYEDLVVNEVIEAWEPLEF